MPRYDITMCEEVWRYHHILIDAPNEALATAKAEEIYNTTGLLEFDYAPDEDDGGGSVVIECKLIEGVLPNG